MSSKDIQVLTDDDQFPIDCPTQLDTVQYTVKEKKAAFPAPPQRVDLDSPPSTMLFQTVLVHRHKR